MNLKKIRILAMLLCTSCLGSIYGDVYDVTDDIWFKAFLQESRDTAQNKIDIKGKGWNSLSKIQKIQLVVNFAQEAYNDMIDEELDKISTSAEALYKRLDDLKESVDSSPKTKEEKQQFEKDLKKVWDDIRDFLSRSSILQLSKKFPTLPEETKKLLNQLNEISKNAKKVKNETLIEKLSFIRGNIKDTIFKSDRKILAGILSNIDKNLSTTGSLSGEAKKFIEKLLTKIESTTFKTTPKDAKLTPAMDDFLPFVKSRYFPILANIRTGKTQQPGCAAFCPEKGSPKFYVATKPGKESALENDPKYDTTKGEYEAEYNATNLLNYSDKTHTERQLVIAALAEDIVSHSYEADEDSLILWYPSLGNKGSFKFNEGNFKVAVSHINKHKKDVLSELTGTLCVFTKDSPCFFPGRDNAFFPCTHWWNEFLNQTKTLKVKIFWNAAYTKAPISFLNVLYDQRQLDSNQADKIIQDLDKASEKANNLKRILRFLIDRTNLLLSQFNPVIKEAGRTEGFIFSNSLIENEQDDDKAKIEALLNETCKNEKKYTTEQVTFANELHNLLSK